MRQFPNHNHRDCENILSFATQPRERGRSGSGLGEQCRGGCCPAALAAALMLLDKRVIFVLHTGND